MQKVGTVVEILDGYVKVELEQHSECTECGMCMGGTSKKVTVSARDTFGSKLGDTVEVNLSPGQSLKAAAIVYLIPLGLLILGIAIGSTVLRGSRNAEAITAVIGLSAAFLGFIVLKFLDKFLTKDDKYQLTITRII